MKETPLLTPHDELIKAKIEKRKQAAKLKLNLPLPHECGGKYHRLSYGKYNSQDKWKQYRTQYYLCDKCDEIATLALIMSKTFVQGQ